MEVDNKLAEFSKSRVLNNRGKTIIGFGRVRDRFSYIYPFS